jgi:hypothetical protein
VLTESYTVSYAQSGTLQAHLSKQPRPAGEELLVLADPVFDPMPIRTIGPPSCCWDRPTEAGGGARQP